MQNREIASILRFHENLFKELHKDHRCASKIVHGEVVDLVDVVFLLEHDEVLLAATRSFHSIFVHFFGHNQPEIRAFELPLGQSARICSFCSSRKILICSLSKFCL